MPERFLEQRDGYIPEVTLASFMAQISRRLGQDGLGLLWAPMITVKDYGVLGDYLLSADNLGVALSRAQRVMPLHSNTDFVRLKVRDGIAHLGYHFGLRSHEGYSDLAYTALAAILSIPRHYLGKNWIPFSIQMDIPRPTFANQVEETFRCPVQFNCNSLSFQFDSRDLYVRNDGSMPLPTLTHGDMVRHYAKGAPKDLISIVKSNLFGHVATRNFNLETTARMLEVGPRKLQRELERSGTTFRDIANRVKAERASELLKLTGQSVASVSMELGYSSPANFSRAFKREVGMPPQHFMQKRA